MVSSVYRNVQHHALIKDNSQTSKSISILYHSWYRKGNMYVVAAFLDGFNRNRKGTHIEQLFKTFIPYKYKV